MVDLVNPITAKVMIKRSAIGPPFWAVRNGAPPCIAVQTNSHGFRVGVLLTLYTVTSENDSKVNKNDHITNYKKSLIIQFWLLEGSLGGRGMVSPFGKSVGRFITSRAITRRRVGPFGRRKYQDVVVI